MNRWMNERSAATLIVKLYFNMSFCNYGYNKRAPFFIGNFSLTVFPLFPGKAVKTILTHQPWAARGSSLNLFGLSPKLVSFLGVLDSPQLAAGRFIGVSLILLRQIY
jgi:hypothetical protein